MSGIGRDEWNAITGTRYPFLSHEFLSAAEKTGCVDAASGWLPRHITASDQGRLLGAMPLYEKRHSWGEFVFDWAWANAYQQAGLAYYPKLVSAVPFTPAASTRLLLRDPGDAETAQALVQAAVQLAKDTGCSSLHVLFPDERDLAVLQSSDMLLRKDCQFHWHNRGYRDFDDFLAGFTSAKRKKARRDRRRVAESGIRFRRIKGVDLDAATWAIVYRLISRTFLVRGSTPYFSEAFFRAISDEIPQHILAVIAELDGNAVAAAVFFESDDALYGRYWGSDGHYDSLHFETCYYQGIDYCIESGKQRFEPGTQGEHKVARGFTPVTTWSAHWLAHPQFASAIETYLGEEGKHVERYMAAVDEHTPYKRAPGGR